MIREDLGIDILGKSAARIRKEASEDLDTANSCKEAAIREKVLEHVEAEAPKILGYIQDEILLLGISPIHMKARPPTRQSAARK
jgi:hypothetical protein